MAVEPILLDFSNDSGMDMQSDLPESDICRITVTDFNNSKVLSDQSNLQLLSRLDVEKLTDEQFDELVNFVQLLKSAVNHFR